MRSESHKKKHKLNLKRFIPAVLIMALAFALVFTVISRLGGPKEAVTWQGRPDPAEFSHIEDTAEEPIHLSIRCVGDIMAHMPQINAAIQPDGSYNFNAPFDKVRPYMQDCDLAMGNMETTFLGDGNYRGYPTFNSPDSLAEAAKNLGLQVAFTSNNHMMDTGLKGVQRSLQVLQDAGLQVVGSRADTSQPRYIITDVKGVKVGIVAYTYETPSSGEARSINGSVMPAGATDYINSFRQDSAHLDQDVSLIADEIGKCRADGADIVICYIHWGEEYQKKSNRVQQTVASKIADAGADIIFASHPHVVQEIGSFDSGYAVHPNGLQNVSIYRLKSVPVFYSMGNFISNQRTETLASVYGEDAAHRTEQELIACVELDYCPDTKELKNVKASAIPLWVEKYINSGKTVYSIIPLVDGFENDADLKASGHTSRAKAALNELTALLGEEYIWNSK